MASCVHLLALVGFLLFAATANSHAAGPVDIRQANPDTKFVALVVGNASYLHAPHLRGVDNDARDIAQLFRALGFTISNKKILDLTRQELAQEIGAFLGKLDSETVALVYFSGHGLEDRGINYLVPVDAKVETPGDVFAQLISLNEVLNQMEQRGARTQIVILDACRNMPEMLKSKSIGGAGGLREITSLGRGTKLVYAAAPGQKALPAGPRERNSVFTGAFIQAASEPLATFDDVLHRAGQLTADRTNRFQLPWQSGTLGMSIKLRPKGVGEEPASNSVPITPTGASLRPLLGIDLSLGDSLARVREAMPSARWSESSGQVLASQPARFVSAIEGVATVWLANNRVSQFTFAKAENGSTWDQQRKKDGHWETFRVSNNGSPLTYEEAVARCEPLVNVKSLLAREFGATSKVVIEDRTIDSAENFRMDPKVVRVNAAVAREWESEYEYGDMRVSAKFDARGWEVRREHDAIGATDMSHQRCEFRLDFKSR